jgi:hypothetical protein
MKLLLIVLAACVCVVLTLLCRAGRQEWRDRRDGVSDVVDKGAE